MIVDIHTHIWDRPDQFGPAAARRIRKSGQTPWQQPDASPQAFDEAMQPVGRAVVHGFESRLLGAHVPAEQVARFVARNPKKYLGFAGIDPLADRARDVSQRVATARAAGLAGVTISPAAAGFHPAHTRAMALYEQCQALNLPIMVETETRFAPAARMEFALPHLFDEVARAFPNLRIILSQVGSPWTDQALTLIAKHEHVWADLSGLVERAWPLYNVLVNASQIGAVDHLLFASRYPFATPQQAVSNIYSINTFSHGTPLPSIPREQLRSIVERDALTALGIGSAGAPDASAPGGLSASSQKAPAVAPATNDDKPADQEPSHPGSTAPIPSGDAEHAKRGSDASASGADVASSSSAGASGDDPLPDTNPLPLGDDPTARTVASRSPDQENTS